MKKTEVSAKSVNSNYELELKNSRATVKRFMAYAQASSNLSSKKNNK